MAAVTTAMGRVTTIPEILDIIFSYNQRPQNARCARVSRSWLDVALNHVWRDCPSLKALFQLLVPLVPSDDGYWSQTRRSTLIFSRPIKPKDWIRFFAFAKRVRSFRLHAQEINLIADSVYTEVSMTRPAVSILPNLEDFSVCGWLTASQVQYSCLFLRESVTFFSFTIQDHSSTAKEVQSLLNLVLQRSPNLKAFSLTFENLKVKKIETDLCLLLNGLRHLKSLCLFPTLLSPSVLNSAASLPDLTDFDINPFSFSLEGGRIGFPLPDTNNAFKSLTSLSMRGNIITVIRFFSHRVFPLRLRTLMIELNYVNEASDFRPCLEALANACPQLKMLAFSMFDAVREPLDSEPITAEDLSPLTSFPLLEEFELQYDKAVSMSDEELIRIVKGCPSLRNLDLNCIPLSAPTESTSLTLGFLALLAKETATVKLERLAIFVDALSTVGLPKVEGQLENLRSISFGVSPICRRNDEVLSYLGQLLPSTCTFDVNVSLHLDEVLGDDGETSRRRQIWKDIGKKLPLTKIRLEEQERKGERD